VIVFARGRRRLREAGRATYGTMVLIVPRLGNGAVDLR
jgi:hypothetical protein